MKVKRNLYSLKNCNPTKKKKRDKIKTMFPYYKDSKLIDLNLLREFIYNNNISCNFLYTEEMIKKQSDIKVYKEDEPTKIKTRFEILDI